MRAQKHNIIRCPSCKDGRVMYNRRKTLAFCGLCGKEFEPYMYEKMGGKIKTKPLKDCDTMKKLKKWCEECGKDITGRHVSARCCVSCALKRSTATYWRDKYEALQKNVKKLGEK